MTHFKLSDFDEFRYLKSQWHKELDCTSFEKKILQIICIQQDKRNLRIFSFSKLDIRAENFRMVDIQINAETPGFTKPNIILKRILYPKKN